MTRSVATHAEVTIGGHLRSQLEQEDRVDQFEFVDRPDLRIETRDLGRWACEITQIPPNDVYQYVHRRFNQLQKGGARAVQVVWPVEPHIWMKSAIESKRKKLQAYKSRSETDRVALLVHEPVDSGVAFFDFESDSVASLLRQAAIQHGGDFFRIYFWSRARGLELLYPGELAEAFELDLRNGYPTQNFTQLCAKSIVLPAAGEDPIEYDFGVVTPEVINVPPISKEFKRVAANSRLRRVRFQATAYADGVVPRSQPLIEPSSEA